MFTQFFRLLKAQFRQFGIGSAVPYLFDIGMGLTMTHDSQSALVFHLNPYTSLWAKNAAGFTQAKVKQAPRSPGEYSELAANRLLR